MKFTELKGSLAAGARNVYLLEGDDAYFRGKGEELIKDAFLQMPELNFSAFDGETLKGSALTALSSALKNFPFMAEKRIIKVSEFYPSEQDFEKYLQPLFDDFPPFGILIIVNTGLKRGVDLKRKRAVCYVDCNRADRDTVAKWAYITLRRAGVSASVSVCENIADYCLCDMARVSVEVDKLIDYKPQNALTEQDIESLVFKDADFRLYELTNTVARRDYAKFCVIKDEILKKGGDEVYILNGLFNYFKNLLTVLTSRYDAARLSSILKMKEYGVKKSAEQAEAIGRKKLEYLTEYVYLRIAEIKSGKILPAAALINAQNAIFFG